MSIHSRAFHSSSQDPGPRALLVIALAAAGLLLGGLLAIRVVLGFAPSGRANEVLPGVGAPATAGPLVAPSSVSPARTDDALPPVNPDVAAPAGPALVGPGHSNVSSSPFSTPAPNGRGTGTIAPEGQEPKPPSASPNGSVRVGSIAPENGSPGYMPPPGRD